MSSIKINLSESVCFEFSESILKDKMELFEVIKDETLEGETYMPKSITRVETI